MSVHHLRCCALLALATLGFNACAADGLATPPAENLWPRWQARIAVQSASVSPLAWSGLLDGGGTQRTVQGGALLGDYYFALPSFGGFRASGGFVSGSLGGLPSASTRAGPLLGMSLDGSALRLNSAGSEAAAALPYLGVGFSSAPWRNGLAISADLGLVAEHVPAAGGVRRAVFGSQALDGALRELRLSPLLQLGVRYTF